MKNIAGFLLVALITIVLIVSQDLIMGISISRAVRNLVTPFAVSSAPEFAAALLLLLGWIAGSLIKNAREKKKGNGR